MKFTRINLFTITVLVLICVFTMCIVATDAPALTDCGLGDINCDGDVNTKDAVLLAQYLAGWENLEIPKEENMNLNGDNGVNTKDAVLLAQYLAGWNVHFTTPPEEGDNEMNSETIF